MLIAPNNDARVTSVVRVDLKAKRRFPYYRYLEVVVVTDEEVFYPHLEALQRSYSQAAMEFETRSIFLLLAGNLSGLVIVLSSVLSRQVCDARYLLIPVAAFVVGATSALLAGAMSYWNARKYARRLSEVIQAGPGTLTVSGVHPENMDSARRSVRRRQAFDVEKELSAEPQGFLLLIALSAVTFFTGGGAILVSMLGTSAALCIR